MDRTLYWKLRTQANQHRWKTIRGARTKLHLVSEWVREGGVTIGQIKTDEKSNEITEIPELLEAFDIAGGIVSIDAMGCQRSICEKVVAKEADYSLAVKMNQPTLLEEISEYFKWAVMMKSNQKFYRSMKQWKKGMVESTNGGRPPATRFLGLNPKAIGSD